MPIVIHVTLPAPLVRNPYHLFQTEEARQLLKLYKSGAKLCI